MRAASLPFLTLLVSSSAPAPSVSSTLPSRAMLLMVASACCFGTMAVLIRIVSRNLHPFEIAFFRSVFGAVTALPLMFSGGVRLLRTDRPAFYLVRCALGTFSMLAAFWSIAHLPLTQAIALSYASPLFVTIGAVLVLGEVVRLRRWSAVFAGFIGVLVIVRPGTEGFSVASLVALFAASMSGAVTISIKQLSRSDPANSIVLLTALLWVPLTLPAALLVWHWPAAHLWPWLIAMGALGTAGQYFWTHALHIADASTLAPFSYLQLLVVAVLAWIVFGETLDRYTAIGAAIVIGSSFYIARREAVLAKRAHRAALTDAAQPQV